LRRSRARSPARAKAAVTRSSSAALGHQIGSAVGALGGGVVFDLFNSYAGLWLKSLALAIVAGAMSAVIRAQTRLAT
jgi:predicted MFS family arabinose efflux permease